MDDRHPRQPGATLPPHALDPMPTSDYAVQKLGQRQLFRCDTPLSVCVLLLQDLLQSCSRGGGRRVEDMCYERLGPPEEPGTLTQGVCFII
jgi:hypothetical protein